jgi:hydroxymethylbilane synthase
MKKIIKIGTRKSALAIKQAQKAAGLLEEVDHSLKAEIVPIRTSGDWSSGSEEKLLSEAEGGKGLFVKEIEKALLEREIDIAAHSMKDVPSFLPEGLVLDHILAREDPRDAFLSHKAGSISELSEGSVIGTSSARRQAFLLEIRPDLKVVPFRGNVPKRIEKLEAGKVDATFLAVAGLKRMDMQDKITSILEPEEMLPSAGQGAIGLEIRQEDNELHGLLREIRCMSTCLCVSAERAALQALDGSCRTPIGAYAEYENSIIRLRIKVASRDGRRIFTAEGSAMITDIKESCALGKKIAGNIKTGLPSGILYK